MARTIKTIYNGFTTILVGLVVLLALLLVGVRLMGLQVYCVLSGSMEPEYPTGSLIYVKEVPTSDLWTGDVITFRMEGNAVATHRIVELVPDESDPNQYRFRTKGDANNAPDGTLVAPEAVLGTPVFTIPYLGYFANFIQNPPGTYIALSVAAVLLLLVFLPDLFSNGEGSPPNKRRKGGKFLNNNPNG